MAELAGHEYENFKWKAKRHKFVVAPCKDINV